MTAFEPTVSFIIPHMGRPELLEATINSIIEQDAFHLVQQIVVITKNTAPLSLAKHPLLEVLYHPEATSISMQRNIGAARSQASYFAFLDADIQLAPDWLSTCLMLLQAKPERIVVSAMQRESLRPSRIERLRTSLSNATVDANVTFLPGRNLLLRSEHHNQVGGFPEHLQTCEDYYYTEKLAELGELYYCSNTFYIHLGEDHSLAQTFSKEIWRSEFNLKSLAGRKVPLREWPSIVLPFWMLGAFLLLLSGFHKPILFGPALLCLVLPIVLYSMRLYKLPHNTLSLFFILVFYAVYFVARAIGTLIGLRFLTHRKNTK